MVTFTTSNVIVELSPNPGKKELIVETPVCVRGASDEIQITLVDHGISATGLVSVSGYAMSATYGIITQNDPITSVIGGTLTISSAAAVTYPSIKIYRIVGESI